MKANNDSNLIGKLENNLFNSFDDILSILNSSVVLFNLILSEIFWTNKSNHSSTFLKNSKH
jgi:hypothetical protein